MIKKWLTHVARISVIAVIIYFIGNAYMASQMPTNDDSMAYSAFVELIHTDQIRKVTINQNGDFQVVTKSGIETKVYSPGEMDKEIINELLKYRVPFQVSPPKERSMLFEIFISWFPTLLLIALIWYYYAKMSPRSGPLGMAKSKAKLLKEESVKVGFDGVAGLKEAKLDVQEMVDFLKDPKKFQRLRSKIPKGALLVGPPGTGKTMLIRAVAYEAKVPFFSISGSDFVEMFVGMGAARVRDMFEEAKKKSPCIIFIDEIDAVGRHRGGGHGGGHDEREQTLNQLLVEMDGFEANTSVMVFAATNRVDVLDPALLRPGRFDRHIYVSLPDIDDREAILRVHLKEMMDILSDDVNIRDIARGTPGFSGADLANLVNEASLLTGRRGGDVITSQDIENAKDKIMMGAERQLCMTPDELKLTAYHEAGHAIVGYLSDEHDPVHKVSILPRGRALGVTLFLPERDPVSASKKKLEGQMATLYGGRVAEELLVGKEGMTTGASNDIERVTDLGIKYVTQWGLSPVVYPIRYGKEEYSNPFSGRMSGSHSEALPMSEEVKTEIKSVLSNAYDRARDILTTHRQELDEMAQLLIECETITIDQIIEIMTKERHGKH